MGLKSTLQWYWDLSSADATITDQHSGLVLTKIGTTTTSPTGGPDGGPCIDFGLAAGKYRNASVAKTISYDDGYTVNIWVRSTGTSSIFNMAINHRNDGNSLPDNRYFQLATRDSSGIDYGATWGVSDSLRIASVSRFAENAWQMLTLRDTGSVTELYRNAVLVASASTSIASRDTGSAAFAIGGHSWSAAILATLDHRGQLAMAGVWNEPLITGDITKLYNGGMGRRYADLGGGIIPILRQHYAAQGAR
jgi:hypothetical protein